MANQDLYRCLLKVKPLTKYLAQQLIMARREMDTAKDYAEVCKARGKIEVLKDLIGLRRKLQKKL